MQGRHQEKVETRRRRPLMRTVMYKEYPTVSNGHLDLEWVSKFKHALQRRDVDRWQLHIKKDSGEEGDILPSSLFVHKLLHR